METGSLYDTYLNCLIEIVEQLSKEAAAQESIAQKESNEVSRIENNCMQVSKELENAQNTVRAQYQSVWESCTQKAGLKRPRDLRPAGTELSWEDAVRRQEKAASEIRDWFQQLTNMAVRRRQKEIREEEIRKAKEAAAKAEAARREAEEAARRKKKHAEALIDEMKQKFRGNI